MENIELLGKFKESFIKQKYNKKNVYNRTVKKYENNQIYVNVKTRIKYIRFIGTDLEETNYLVLQSGYDKDLDNADETLDILINDYLNRYISEIDSGRTKILDYDYFHSYITKFPKAK